MTTHFLHPAARHRTWIALVACAIAPPLRAQDRPRQPVLEIAVEDEAAPWSSHDGTGYANDFVRAAFAAAGVEVKLSIMPYARCKQMAIEGALPACVSMSPNMQRPDPVDFSTTPIFAFASDYFERSGHPGHAARAADLPRGTRVGVVLGYEYPESIYRLSRDGVIVLEYSASETINLRKLVAGRLDAAMVNHDALKTLEYVLATAGVTGKVQRLFSAGTMPAYVGFSRRHAQAAWAFERFTRGAAVITANGTAARIMSRWKAHVRAGATVRPGPRGGVSPR